MAERLLLIREWYRSGQYQKLTPALEKMISEKNLTPEIRVECADIAKRTGNTPLAVRILAPRVRPHLEHHPSEARTRPQKTRRKTIIHATDEELAAYAVATGILGAQGESEHAFAAIDEATFPRVVLLRGVAALGRWDYALAIQCFEKFLNSSATLDPEDQWTAQTRLAMSLIRCQQTDPIQSEKLLRSLLENEKIPTPHRMWAWQIQAELHYVKGNWKETLRQVEALMHRHPEHRSPGLIFWRSFLSIRHGIGSIPQHQEDIEKECRKADQETYGYIRRIADLHRAFILKDSQALTRLFYGSPFPELRAYALRRFGDGATIPNTFIYRPSLTSDLTDSPLFNLFSGILEYKRKSYRPSAQVLALARILSLETYQPVTAAEIHEKLFPGEWPWDARASQRVQMAISRLRNWCQEVDPSLTSSAVESLQESSSYRWSPHLSWRFEIRRSLLEKEAVAQNSATSQKIEIAGELEIIQKKLGPRLEFSTSDLAETLNISLRSAVAKAKEFTQSGDFSVKGKGRATRYSLVAKRA
jgi:hypothetical protein